MEEISCVLIIRSKSLENNNLHQIRKLLAGQLCYMVLNDQAFDPHRAASIQIRLDSS